MSRVGRYLQIPTDYCRPIGDLQWSENGEAIEVDGATFAFASEIARFLEGMMAGGRLLHFGFVLHLLHLLGRGDICRQGQSWRLHRSFQSAGRNLRNAGVLCAHLCRSVPAVADRIDNDTGCKIWVSSSALLSLVGAALAADGIADDSEFPPLQPEAFEQVVLNELARLDDAELRHWLQHGCSSLDRANQSLAEVLDDIPPPTLEHILHSLGQRERLLGAAPYVDQMVSALALPRRQLSPPELPLGGFADVTNRGQPEQLLPSQYLLEDLEFVRRFAANELLFFRREEPHQQQREELVLVLDQGVRTWGTVRLMLAAAVLALVRRAIKHRIQLRLAGTSNGGLALDPIQVGEEEICKLIEASDLSPDPALALERVLQEPAGCPRDVVLLTHPRNLAEPDVAVVSRRATGLTRLFAITVDSHGSSALVELRRGTSLPLRRFQLHTAPPQPMPEPANSAPEHAPWTGTIEPVPFPFRFGVAARLTHIAFDPSEEWLLVAAANGMLYLEHLGHGFREVLPRGFVNGLVLKEIEAVLGVAGGFAVCGCLGARRAVIHYDLATRSCSCHLLAEVQGPQEWMWVYIPEYHSVVVRERAMCYGVDLATGETGSHGMVDRTAPTRVELACAVSSRYLRPPPELSVQADRVPVDDHRACIRLDPKTGVLRVHTNRLRYYELRPQANGVPVLRKGRLLQAQQAGDVLAIKTVGPAETHRETLRLLRISVGSVIWEGAAPEHRFVLSPKGRYLARQISVTQVSVVQPDNPGHAFVTPAGKCHNNMHVELGFCWMILQVGQWTHLIRWDGEELVWKHGTVSIETLMQSEDIRRLRTQSVTASRYGLPTVPMFHYDHWRFRSAAARKEMTALVDESGQVALYDSMHNLLAMLFIFRNAFAAWMPDGTRFGPASITGGPSTVDALARIGRTLRTASEKGRGMIQ